MKNFLFILCKSSFFEKEQLIEYLNLNKLPKAKYFLADSSKILKFNDGEISVNICPDFSFLDNAIDFNFKNIDEAIIFSSISTPVNDNLMEVLIIVDALKRAGIKNISLNASYLSYMRQDRRMKNFSILKNENCALEFKLQNYVQNSEPITSKLIFKMLGLAGLKKIKILDPHFSQVEALSNNLEFSIIGYEFLLGFIIEAILKIFFLEGQIDYNQNFINFFKKIWEINLEQKYYNLDSSSALEKIQENFLLNRLSENLDLFEKFYNFLNHEFVLISPDAGALKKTRDIAFSLDLIFQIGKNIFENKITYNPLQICFIEKIRSAPGVASAVSLTGDVKNKNGLIIDDILDSGSTLVNAVEILKIKSCAKSISAFITHAILSGNAVEKIQNSSLKFMFITNSISNEKHKDLSEKFFVFSLNKIIRFLI